MKNHDCLSNYRKDYQIGQGGFGSVFLCQDRSDGQKYAMKILTASDEHKRAEFMKEVEIMQSINAPFCVKIRSAFFEGDKFYIISEYCKNGTMDHFINKHKETAQFPKMWNWLAQIALAVQSIHKEGIVHLDLNVQNVFFTEDWQIRVGDFGLARVVDGNSQGSRAFGTLMSVAPERCRDIDPSLDERACDWWGFGTIAHHLITRHPLCNTTSFTEWIKTLCSDEPFVFPPTLSQSELILLQGLLEKNPRKRWGHEELKGIPELNSHLELSWLGWNQRNMKLEFHETPIPLPQYTDTKTNFIENVSLPFQRRYPLFLASLPRPPSNFNVEPCDPIEAFPYTPRTNTPEFMTAFAHKYGVLRWVIDEKAILPSAFQQLESTPENLTHFPLHIRFTHGTWNELDDAQPDPILLSSLLPPPSSYLCTHTRLFFTLLSFLLVSPSAALFSPSAQEQRLTIFLDVTPDEPQPVQSHPSYFHLAGFLIAKAVEQRITLDMTFTHHINRQLCGFNLVEQDIRFLNDHAAVILANLKKATLSQFGELGVKFVLPVVEEERKLWEDAGDTVVSIEDENGLPQSAIELKPNGMNQIVTPVSLQAYTGLLLSTLTRAPKQKLLSSLLSSFHTVLPRECWSSIAASEVERLVKGIQGCVVDVAGWMENTRCVQRLSIARWLGNVSTEPPKDTPDEGMLRDSSPEPEFTPTNQAQVFSVFKSALFSLRIERRHDVLLLWSGGERVGVGGYGRVSSTAFRWVQDEEKMPHTPRGHAAPGNDLAYSTVLSPWGPYTSPVHAHGFTVCILSPSDTKERRERGLPCVFSITAFNLLFIPFELDEEKMKREIKKGTLFYKEMIHSIVAAQSWM
ncbi:putative RAC serine/threonine-protein kinase [Blattamonas nauphoetae]|uniref:non-specific serine/threonine protein kinase n=1 Tax=Blattamonas nauphoetae TaxID=2049346 RepID=A0ABQ9X7H2_9EUKA|nr:putative RAC serine/threonine-protein kinase [Blattamonas nauphoetae]